MLKKVVTQVGAKLGRGKSQARRLKISEVESGGGNGTVHSVTLPRQYYIVNILFRIVGATGGISAARTKVAGRLPTNFPFSKSVWGIDGLRHISAVLAQHLPAPLAMQTANLLKPVVRAIEHRGNLGGSVAAQKTDQLAD
jgi:hypothetical protein